MPAPDRLILGTLAFYEAHPRTSMGLYMLRAEGFGYKIRLPETEANRWSTTVWFCDTAEQAREYLKARRR